MNKFERFFITLFKIIIKIELTWQNIKLVNSIHALYILRIKKIKARSFYLPCPQIFLNQKNKY